MIEQFKALCLEFENISEPSATIKLQVPFGLEGIRKERLLHFSRSFVILILEHLLNMYELKKYILISG